MVNPNVSLRDYLWKLISRYANIKMYKKQLDILEEWKSPNRKEAIDKGATFFKLVEASFKRTMLVELSLFVNEKEQVNIYDWLNKAKEHSKSLKPTKANKDKNIKKSRVLLKDTYYKKVINKHVKKLSSHNDITKNLIAHRDKILSHYDSSYFNRPKTVYKKYAIDILELNNLMKTIEDILSKHHSYLFESSIASFDVSSYTNVNMILTYTRAFSRIRKDKDLIIGKGFRPADYLKEIFPEKK